MEGLDEDMFDIDTVDEVPENLQLEIVQEYHSWSGNNDYSDDYREQLEEYQEKVAETVTEKDTIYEIQTNTSIKQDGAMHETWIFYAEE